MGYQNNERPTKKECKKFKLNYEEQLACDVFTDLTDLRFDIVQDHPKSELLDYIDFIYETQRKLLKSLKKKNRSV